MKKLCLMFAVVLTVLLAACGEMSQQDVVEKLTTNLNDAKSYYATGVMEVDNNGQVYQYNVEVDRIALARCFMRCKSHQVESIISLMQRKIEK